MEKYRPNTLDDVSGHQDILATINRFIEHNVQMSVVVAVAVTDTKSSVYLIFSSMARPALARRLRFLPLLDESTDRKICVKWFWN